MNQRLDLPRHDAVHLPDCTECGRQSGTFFVYPGKRYLCELCHEKTRLGQPIYPHVSENPEVQCAYENMRQKGQSHRFAEMCAFRQPFGLSGTDQVLHEGHCNGSQFAGQDRCADQYKRQAEAAGVSTTGAIYMASLARYPGDPRAWIRSRAEIKAQAESRNLHCEGLVDHEPRETPPTPSVGLDPRILREEVDYQKSRLEGPISAQEEADLTESTWNRIKPDWVKDPCPGLEKAP